MPLSKPFVIATEGPTIDGRNISKEWIQQMAASYDTKVYTAVANLEHLLSYSPDSMFSSYGKVVSLSTQEATIMGDKKLQLMAVVDVSQEIVSMQKAGKKLFSSIEPTLNFINKGIAYLTGLGFTDTPASIGTESMKFSANQGKDSIYSFAGEIAIEWEPDAKQTNAGETLLFKVKELLGMNKKDHDARFSDIGQAVEAIALSQKGVLEKFAAAPDKSLSAEVTAFRKQIADMETEHKKTADDFSAFKAEVEKMSGTAKPRPAATGGKDGAVTDC